VEKPRKILSRRPEFTFFIFFLDKLALSVALKDEASAENNGHPSGLAAECISAIFFFLGEECRGIRHY
jgi:hypothetical protein